MKRLSLIVILCGLAIPVARGADQHVVDDLFKQAQAAMTAGKFDDALQLDEKVMIEHPEACDRWYDAQMGITQALIKKGDLDGAAKSAHLCLDAASIWAYDGTVGLIAGILSAQDKKVDRANQFIAFQQTGTGTNPMDAVGYPSLPQREAAFATLRGQAGDDSMASRFRALTYLFTGHPKDALAQFAEACHRSDDNPYELPQRISDVVGLGLRAVRGQRVGLDEAIQFVVWGPNGPDGKPGSADDLADPFAPFLPPVPAAGEGGLAELPAADLAVLQQVRDAAQLYSGDETLSLDVRNRTLTALQRVNNALDGWGAPGQEDWYRSRALDLVGPNFDEGTRGLLLHGAELAARGRGLNLGAAHELWNEVAAQSVAAGLQDNKTIVDDRAQFDKMCVQISQIKFSPVNYKPLTAPATF